MKKIGITGGIASGKSTLTGYLRDKGYPIIDADQISRSLLDPDQEGYEELVQAFGREILLASGHVDRAQLGKLVFSQPALRKKLEAILHPLIFQKIETSLEGYQEHGLVFIELPLLFETGYDKKVDQVWLVHVSQDLQLERLKARNNLSDQEARDRIMSQMSEAERIKKAQIILNNDGSLDDLVRQVDYLLSQLERGDE